MIERAENEKINKNNASYCHAIIPNKNYTSNFQRSRDYKRTNIRSFSFLVRCSLSFSSNELVHFIMKNASKSSVKWSIHELILEGTTHHQSVGPTDACADSEDLPMLVQTASGNNGSLEARKESGPVC